MSTSNMIATAALFVTILAVPISSHLSYVAAQKAYLFEKRAEKISELLKYKNRLEEHGNLLARLMKTVALEKYNVDFSSNSALTDFNSNRESIYREMYSYGVVQDIKDDIDNLERLGFFSYINDRNPDVFDSLISLKVHLFGKVVSPGDQVYSCYRTLYEHNVLEKIKAIDDSDLRDFF